MRRASRTAWTALTGLLGGLAVGLCLPPSASAEEVYPRPADGVFALEGHGWGHGHGLSQWGAEGAATLGVSAETIVATYYPGTERAVLPETPIRVLLQAAPRDALTVVAAAGLTVTDLGSGGHEDLPSGPSRWRVVDDASGLRVEGLSGTTWSPFAVGGRTALGGPVRFGGPDTVRLVYEDGSARDYRGSLDAVRTGDSTLATVDTLGLEAYLLGVVPRESSSSWQPAALQAQAIAARSYSAYKREHAPSSAAWDICDSTQCQVFGGTRFVAGDGSSTDLEAAATTEAVKATAGVVRTYQGHPVFAEFGSSNGGWSTDGGQPYLAARQDDWDGAVASSVHSWKATLPVTALEQRFPALGHLTRLRVLSRDGHGDWGGRVGQVVLEGTDAHGAATSVTTSGVGVYLARSWPSAADGLRSTWWRVTPSLGAGLVSRSAPPRLVLPPGTPTAQLTAVLRNTGSEPWPLSDLHLVVASPPGEADLLAGGRVDAGRVVRNRSRPGADTALPGDLVELAVDLDARHLGTGSYGRTYRLRLADGPVFGDRVSWVVPVEAPLLRGAPAGAGPKPVVVARTGSATVRVAFRNTGNVASPAGTGDVSGPAVAPGAVGWFDVRVSGAGRPAGVTRESYGPAWSDPATVTVVRVDPALPRAAAAEQLPGDLSLTDLPAPPSVLVVRLRNLGRDPWAVGTERLRATKASGLETPQWSSGSPPPLAASVTRPGARSVAPGEVGEWRVPVSAARRPAGTYRLELHGLGPAGPYGPAVSSTVVVSHAVVSGQVTAVGASVVVPSRGRAATVFEVRNTGTVPWPAGGLVRSVARDGSASAAPSWLSPTRPGAVLPVAGGTSVLPGQVGRFVVELAGNGRAPGDRSESFGVVWEGFANTPVRVRLSYTVR